MGNLITTRMGTALLILGAVLVGVAIALDGSVANAINGAGGALWFASAAILLTVAIRAQPPRRMWATLVVLTLTVAFIVKPADWVLALAGFIPTGLVIGMIAARHRILWAALIAAWYLPAHIGTAVMKSAVRAAMGDEAPLRTDPPPTAAIVPLVIVLSALAGGYLAVWWAERRHSVFIGEG